MMDIPSTSIKDLARRLLSIEAATRAETDPDEAERVCEKLRATLTRFAGADGFLALMRRSLALARQEVPALAGVKLRPDGCFVGFEAALNCNGSEAGAALTAHFLWLLVTFVGEPMALRLVSEAWPDVLMDYSLTA